MAPGPAATLAFLASFIAPAAFPQTSATASISGTITGDDGKALSAVVIANRNAPPAASGRAQSSASGAFAISNLPAGTYTLCAAVENLGYLDPCTWQLQPSTVQVATGQKVTGAKLVVKKGATLQVRLNDPGHILGQTAALQQVAPHVMLGVFTPRHVFRQLPLVSTDANGRNHQGAVPLDNTPASLYVTGRGVKITDESGTPIPATGLTVPVKPGGGNGNTNSAKPITFNVSK
jgi:hypothetical protein